MSISETAFSRFRAVGERYRQLTAAENDVRNRLAAAIRARLELQQERQRLAEPRYVGGGPGGRLVQLDNTEALAQVDCRIGAAETAIALLKTEAERAEARKSDAGDLLSRCAEFLRDLGAERHQLEY